MDKSTVSEPYLSAAFLGEAEWLLRLNPDRLLSGFRHCAGLDTHGAARYDGWEKGLIGGHTMGHYLTALAQATASGGIGDVLREKLTERLEYVVDSLRECQLGSRGKPGYLFASMVPGCSDPEAQFNNVEEEKCDIMTQAWVPWYTMHKILAGLISVYELTGNGTALDTAADLGRWTADRVLSWDEDTRLRTMRTEYGGMNDALYELYAVTGEERFAAAAHIFDEVPLFEAVLAGGRDVLNDIHANTTIPKFLGALNRYIALHGKTVGGAAVDAARYLDYAAAFFDMVVNRHTYITGGHSEWEHFGRDLVLDAERTAENCETCNSHNMMKLARGLFLATGNVKYLHYYERTYINSIISSRNPQTGMTTYFQPMASGYFKVYGTPEHSFWCCTGTGMENFTKLGDSICYHNDNTLAVSLYVSGTLDWPEKGLSLVITADLAGSGRADFSVTASGSTRDISIAFRVPDWAQSFAVIRNGAGCPFELRGGFALVRGPFADGEKLSVIMPPALTAEALPDEPSSIAFRYGPYVLSVDMGTDGMVTGTTGVDVTVPTLPAGTDCETVVLPAGTSPARLLRDPAPCFDADMEQREFTLRGTGLKYGLHCFRYRERYGIYFRFKEAE